MSSGQPSTAASLSTSALLARVAEEAHVEPDGAGDRPGYWPLVSELRRRGEREIYLAEMKRPEAQHALALLAALSHTTNFAVGCYCEDESRCHRSLLRQLLIEHGARVG